MRGVLTQFLCINSEITVTWNGSRVTQTPPPWSHALDLLLFSVSRRGDSGLRPALKSTQRRKSGKRQTPAKHRAVWTAGCWLVDLISLTERSSESGWRWISEMCFSLHLSSSLQLGIFTEHLSFFYVVFFFSWVQLKWLFDGLNQSHVLSQRGILFSNSVGLFPKDDLFTVFSLSMSITAHPTGLFWLYYNVQYFGKNIHPPSKLTLCRVRGKAPHRLYLKRFSRTRSILYISVYI